MSIGNLILGVNSVTVSCLTHYDSLLQNATAILLQNAAEVYYKIRHVYYYKMRHITKCDSYYKFRRFYYKMGQVLQNATFVTNCNSTM